jgi:ADP-ribose pyrophosphatase YjhB (NUDIX family)
MSSIDAILSFLQLYFLREVVMDTREFKYCPFCGDRLLHPKEYKDTGPRCVECRRIFHSTPHPTVSAIITDEKEEHVLLTRRKLDPLKGYWDIPGGFLDLGESLEEGLQREMREEMSIEIEIISFLGSYPGVYGAERIPTINIYYHAVLAKGKPTAGSDVLEIRQFHHERIPPTLAFEDGLRALETWVEQRSSKHEGK